MTVRKRLPHTPQPMHYWEGFEGLRLAGDSWGQSGPLVVLLHGGGQTRHAWKGAGQMLADTGYHRGCGRRPRSWRHGLGPRRPLRRRCHGRGSRVRARGPGRRRPDPGRRLDGRRHESDCHRGGPNCRRALVLVDMAPKIEAEGSAKIIEFMERHQSGFDSLEEVAVAISLYQPHRSRPRRLVGLAKNVRIGEDGRYYWHWDPRFSLCGKRHGVLPLAWRHVPVASPCRHSSCGERAVGRRFRGGGL